MPQSTNCRPQDASPEIALEALSFIDHGLHRPECVLCTRCGDICTSHWGGGKAHILPDDTRRLYRGTLPSGRELRSNGFSLQSDGSFLAADLGAKAGDVFRLDRDGTVRVFLDQFEGVTLPPTNVVFTAPIGRTWTTVNTRRTPRASAYRRDVADGFIISNRIIRFAPDGQQQLILEDADLDHPKGLHLKNLSSLAFGGPDPHTAYLGNLLRCARLRRTARRRPPSHSLELPPR